MGRRITDGMSYRDILRQHLPGHTYVLYSNDPVMLESIASAVYQFNAREGKKCNLWLPQAQKEHHSQERNHYEANGDHCVFLQ